MDIFDRHKLGKRITLFSKVMDKLIKKKEAIFVQYGKKDITLYYCKNWGKWIFLMQI